MSVAARGTGRPMRRTGLRLLVVVTMVAACATTDLRSLIDASLRASRAEVRID